MLAGLPDSAARAAAYVRLGDLVDPQRGLYARLDAGAAQRILQRERIHQRRQHAHVVGGRAIHPCRTGRHAAKDVAAADDDRDLHAKAHHFGDLGDNAIDRLALDAVAVAAHQRLAGQLEQDSPIRRRRRRCDSG